MTRRPLRPTFDPSKKEDFLSALERARHFSLQYAHAQDFKSDARKRCDALQAAIDELAEELTGNKEHFWLRPHSSTSK